MTIDMYWQIIEDIADSGHPQWPAIVAAARNGIERQHRAELDIIRQQVATLREALMNLDQDAHLRSVVELYRADQMAIAEALVRMREELGALRERLEQLEPRPA